MRADFNGLFGNVLCLSHGPTCKEQSGAEVILSAGMILTAFDEDADEHGNRNDLVATGTVEPSQLVAVPRLEVGVTNRRERSQV